MVIAPLSANTMAKIVNGMADGLLTSVVRAWDTDASVDGLRDSFLEKKKESLRPSNGFENVTEKTIKVKEILVCPAMNTAMWRQPITKKQIGELKGEFGRWVEVLAPMSKELACGDVGDGAMVDWRGLVRILKLRCCFEPLGKA